MVGEKFLALTAFLTTLLTPTPSEPRVLLSPIPEKKEMILAQHELNLTNRSQNEKVNEIFKDNILLALRYFAGQGEEMKGDWERVRHPFEFSFALQPGEVFVFHESLLPEFKDLPIRSSRTDYSPQEGYKITGGLSGNGVCHLASLMNWTASEAGLAVTAKVSHDFMPIPEVPEEYGTSIRSLPKSSNSQNQNLYLRNNSDRPVAFDFKINSRKVKLRLLWL